MTLRPEDTKTHPIPADAINTVHEYRLDVCSECVNAELMFPC